MQDTREFGAWHGWPPLLFALILALFAPSAPADDEVDKYLATMRVKMEDRARPIEERERLALEMAATIDRTAQSASTIEIRRFRWAEAATLLDQFNAATPDHPRSPEFQLQAAIYLWARAQNWLRELETSPSDSDAKTQAGLELKDVISRLSSLVEGAKGTESVILRARYRLALALRDRARFVTDRLVDQRKILEQALAQLPTNAAEAAVRGYVDLLRADLLNDLEHFDGALKVASAISASKPGPDPSDVIQAKIRSLVGLKKFDDALALIPSAKFDEPTGAATRMSVQLASRRHSLAGEARDRAESEAVREWQILRKSGTTESRRASVMLSRGMEKPGQGSGPEVWEAVAEGRLLRGDSRGAIELLNEGAERAESSGNRDAAYRMRYAAGAALFQAKQFARAAKELRGIAEDSHAGAFRPKASLLRTLALARQGRPREGSAGDEDYAQALEAHIQHFPDDPTTGEARWLLGQARAESGDAEGSVAAWDAIPRSSTRWLDARLAISAVQQSAAEASLAIGDRSTARHELAVARATLDRSLAEAGDLSQRDEIELARARLELIPEVGDDEKAKTTLDRLVARPLRVESRQRLALFKLAQLLRASRFSEAEREALALAGASTPQMLLDMATLLDLAASTSDSNVVQRRHGIVLKTIVRPLLDAPSNQGSTERKQAVIEMARAIAFSGDAAAARSYLERSGIRADSVPDRLLALLASTQAQLDAHTQAIETYRKLTTRTRSGSRAWLEARYGMAVAYDRSGQPKPAKQILEATSLLHPELGGGDLRAKYERLRARLAR